MRTPILLFILFFCQTAFSQTTVTSKSYGTLTFKEYEHGEAKVEAGTTERLANTPTGTHGWLQNFEIVKITDSIQIAPKANFGVVYMIGATDSVDVDVTIEWVYPKKIRNDKGESFKSIKFTSKRPTNTLTATSYSLDEPYEFVKGKWQLNIYLENKKVLNRNFILYNEARSGQ